MGRENCGPELHRRTAGSEGRAVAAPSQVGEALWRGRLRMGLSVADVAHRAHADVQAISAIEDSDFAHMPPLHAAIATARAYARIVGLPQKWVALTLAAELTHRIIENLPST